jgi:hypothetical protein
MPDGTKQTGIGFKDAVTWAAANYEKVVSEENGRIILRWDKATEPPPNDLARSYMKVASSNPAHFFGRMVPSLLGGDDAISVEDMAADKKLVSQIRSVIRKFVDYAQK